MKYQLRFYDPGPESWRFYREEFEIVSFATPEEAETKAIELSQGHFSGREVVVLTIHACFKTETEYPRVEPVQRTRRIELARTVGAVGQSPSDPI